MSQPAERRTYAGTYPIISRILMVIAFICFLLGALLAASLFTSGTSWVPWMLGGFASIALAWAIP
jgi:hypothetical protein